MTAEQEQHLARVKAQFAAEANEKYRAGAEAHQAQGEGALLELTTLQLIREAKQECVDQYVYLQRAEERVLKFLESMKP